MNPQLRQPFRRILNSFAPPAPRLGESREDHHYRMRTNPDTPGEDIWVMGCSCAGCNRSRAEIVAKAMEEAKFEAGL
jgi:hypothetical protein